MTKQETIKATAWDKLSRTDPAHTSRFKRAGGFSGTALKPIWVIKQLTDVFGEVGVGWGMGKPEFEVVPGDNREVLVFCTLQCWHTSPENTFYGVGGDKIVKHIKANEKFDRPERWDNNDEAFKMATTDALLNAFKNAGVGADIHMGQFDDSKYVKEVQEEFEREQKLNEVPKVEGDYCGPKGKKTELRQRANKLRLALQQVDKMDDLKKTWANGKALVEQLEKEWPNLLYGVNGDDIGIIGEKDAAKARLSESEEFTELRAALEEVDTKAELAHWTATYGDRADALGDVENARITELCTLKEAAVNQVAVANT